MQEYEAILSLKRGNISALDVLVESHQEKAFRTAYLITCDKSLAEDAVQDAFIQAYHAIDSFDVHRPFSPWFMTIVANRALKLAQKHNRHLSLNTFIGDSEISFEDLLPDNAPGPLQMMEQEDLRRAVHDALQKLTPEQRTTIVMRYYLGYSETEMSTALEHPSGTIKSRLHRARNILAVLLTRFQGQFS